LTRGITFRTVKRWSRSQVPFEQIPLQVPVADFSRTECQTCFVIAAHVRDRSLQAQLAAAIVAQGPAVAVKTEWCRSADSLYAAVADRGATIAITDWIGETDAVAEAAVRRLRDEFPTVAVLAYAPLTAAGAKGILAAGRAGVQEVIIAGHDDTGRALAAVLARAATVSTAERAIVRLSALVPSDVMPILAYALRHARAVPEVSDAAQALHLHRKTLAEYCRRANVPPPGELIGWSRLIMAAERLADPGRSAERVAVEFGYSSGSAFANMLRRYTGLAVADVRIQGPSVVLEALGRHLAASGKKIPLARHQGTDPAALMSPESAGKQSPV